MTEAPSLIPLRSRLPDPRLDSAPEHDLSDLLVIAVCTVLVSGRALLRQGGLRPRPQRVAANLPEPAGRQPQPCPLQPPLPSPRSRRLRSDLRAVDPRVTPAPGARGRRPGRQGRPPRDQGRPEPGPSARKRRKAPRSPLCPRYWARPTWSSPSARSWLRAGPERRQGPTAHGSKSRVRTSRAPAAGHPHAEHSSPVRLGAPNPLHSELPQGTVQDEVRPDLDDGIARHSPALATMPQVH